MNGMRTESIQLLRLYAGKTGQFVLLMPYNLNLTGAISSVAEARSLGVQYELNHWTGNRNTRDNPQTMILVCLLIA